MAINAFYAALKYKRIKFLLGDRSTFGCGWHRFRRARRCSLQDLTEFASKWEVSLPAEFKAVLREVGNGCGGPYYGISPLDSWSQPWDPSELEPSILSRPFDPSAPRQQGLHAGAMRICNAGCEHYVLLVVTGAHAGEIWHDGAGDGRDLFPILDSYGRNASFASWIAGWVHGSAATPDDPFWSSFDSDGHAVAQVIASATAPLTSIAVDQLPCPACVRRLAPLRPVPRVVVPTPVSAAHGFANPKRAAMLAARHQIQVEPRQVMPAPRLLLG